ncbi:MAG TPA: response regulator transcription factor [Pseudonocardiaceae bacterium]|nr:response regulator transcription factor [Pseudonocardiaceae bacterium]
MGRRVTVGPLTVAILSDDPLTSDGARAYLRTRPELALVEPGELTRPDALLVLVADLSDEMLAAVEQTAHRMAPPPKTVLVANSIREHQLLRAVGYGLVSVIPRHEASYDRIVEVLLGSREGDVAMPGVAIGWLVEYTRLIQRDVLAPMGLTAAGLLPREVDVLRLLAEGLPTNEIAEKLNYSERTIKSIIHALMTRLGLRNRPHAVAYAMRIGAL